MANNKTYQNILKFSDLLNQRDYVSPEQAAWKLKVSVRTIKSYVKILKTDYHAPIKHSRKRGGYYFTDNFNIATHFGIGYEAFSKLNLAVKTLNQFRHLAVFRDFQETFDRIERSVRFKFSQDTADLIHFETVPPVGGTEHIPFLLDSIKNKRELAFYYQSFQNPGESVEHIVHPCVVKEHANRWYLIAWLPVHQSVTVYGLDRILPDTLRHTGQTFRPGPGFDVLEYFCCSYGMTVHRDQPVADVVLHFSPDQKPYFESKPFHVYEPLPCNEPGLRVKMRLIPNKELVRKLAELGPSVRVLEPDSLIQELSNYLRAALSQYP